MTSDKQPTDLRPWLDAARADAAPPLDVRDAVLQRLADVDASRADKVLLTFALCSAPLAVACAVYMAVGIAGLADPFEALVMYGTGLI